MKLVCIAAYFLLLNSTIAMAETSAQQTSERHYYAIEEAGE